MGFILGSTMVHPSWKVPDMLGHGTQGFIWGCIRIGFGLSGQYIRWGLGLLGAQASGNNRKLTGIPPYDFRKSPSLCTHG